VRRLFAILPFLIAVAIFSGGIWSVGYRTALVPIAEQGQVYLKSASERLVGQLARYRQIAVFVADHPDIVALASGDQSELNVEALLLQFADLNGALEIGLVDGNGTKVATSKADAPPESFTGTEHFRRAMTGALGFDHSVLPDGTRIFGFLAPVYAASQPVAAVLVRVDMEKVEESDWRSAAQVVFFTDDEERIFVTNRSEILYQQVSTTPGAAEFAPRSLRDIGDQVEWTLKAARFLPNRALYLEISQPIIGMTGRSLISTETAFRLASLQAITGATVCLAFGAILLFATERRRTLAEANTQLELRVAARTEQLTEANQSLRHEIAERREAEEALRRAQAELVQAGKLSALGKMSAGISHELNQPLMAIRSFAENGAQFLDRKNPAEASRNFDRISELSRRMGRIIKNLRAFARQESEPATDVDMIAVIEAVLELAQPRLDNEDVHVQLSLPNAPVWVRGGEVRLQQVVMNLVSNAADAMVDSETKTLEIGIEIETDKVRVVIADTGPGLDDPDKIFDPFYSTKEVGQSEGMGLGLSISYGLVQSFGGAISGRNRTAGGAEFTVELTASKDRAAA
jgi:two-component system C4-dicarboxylate transport sensor histidine kinase DctB